MSSSGHIQVILNDLDKLRDVQAEIEKRYVEDVLELEKKYLELRAPIFRRTKDLISGDLKPSANVEANSTNQDQAHTKGIPGFWLRVFQNHPVLKELITQRDEHVLEHLVDVHLGPIDKSSGPLNPLLGYTLTFKFDYKWRSPRPFSNKVLSKTYYYAPTQLSTGSRCHSCSGTEIDWVDDDWTRGSTFFSFFRSLSLPSDQCIRDKEINGKDLRQTQDQLKEDFQLGQIIVHEVLPRITDWFSGKSLVSSSEVFSRERRSRNSPNQRALYWEELLVWSVQYGNIEAVRTILQDKTISVDVNWRDVDGYSALEYAIGGGYGLIVNELLQDRDIDLSSCPTLLLYAMARSSKVFQSFIGHPVVSAWFKQCCPDWPEALPAASSGDREFITNLLLGHERLGVDINYKGVDGYTALLRAIRYMNPAVGKLLLSCADIDVNARDSEGRSPLSLVANSCFVKSNPDYIRVVRLLLQHKDIDVNSRDNHGRTALFYAAGRGNEEIVELLVTSGDIDIGIQDIHGYTPLLWAIGGPRIVQLLIRQKGLDVNARNKEGGTALFSAAQYGRHGVVKELLDHGEDIDVNMGNYAGWTPLTSAAGNGHDEVVKLLLEHRDIKVNLAGGYGRTALYHAIQKEKHSTVQLLQKFGAK